MQVRLPALSRRHSLAVVAGEEDVPAVWARYWVFCSEHIPQCTASVSSQNDESREDLPGPATAKTSTCWVALGRRAADTPIRPLYTAEHCPKHWDAECSARQDPSALPSQWSACGACSFLASAGFCDHQTTTSRLGRRWARQSLIHRLQPRCRRSAGARPFFTSHCSFHYRPSPHTPAAGAYDRPPSFAAALSSAFRQTLAVQCAQTANVRHRCCSALHITCPL